jgi:hypothetical protein
MHFKLVKEGKIKKKTEEILQWSSEPVKFTPWRSLLSPFYTEISPMAPKNLRRQNMFCLLITCVPSISFSYSPAAPWCSPVLKYSPKRTEKKKRHSSNWNPEETQQKNRKYYSRTFCNVKEASITYLSRTTLNQMRHFLQKSYYRILHLSSSTLSVIVGISRVLFTIL